MRRQELIFNLLLGGSLIYWGLAGFIFNYEGIEKTPIRIFITLLNILVGSLIIFRKPIIKAGSNKANLISLPSLICGGLMFKLSKHPSEWENYTQVIFMLGGIIMLTSFLFLGKNFAILPNMRRIVINGTFKVIRHPAYFGETVMIIACLLSTDTIFSLLTFIFFLPSLALRIIEEEKLLSQNSDYEIYKTHVKWRLIPYVW